MNLHSFQLYLALLTVVISTVTPLSCGPCNLDKCVKAVCKAGFVKDACGCCSVCAKTEGQKCGGLWNYYGICGAGLRCISSSDNSHQSSNHFKSGYCEPDLCANIQCKEGTSCVVVDGQPTCKCPRHCKNTKEPICEVKTGKEFINECFLRKYECKTGQSLTFYTGACRKCFHNGIMYKYGETIYKKRGCQFCSCRHGSWECDSKCKDEEIIPCKVSMIFYELVCPSGLICQKDVTMDGKPGICVPSKKPKPTEFFTEHTTKSPELPGIMNREHLSPRSWLYFTSGHRRRYDGKPLHSRRRLPEVESSKH
uniref:Toxin candidate TRINITY_DN18171_c0_g1_i2 n=1 Tax=Ceriantheomorphe brasiliensis TaxID=1048506 RepID=A0A7G7WZ77_9CNID|nr:toxin candidate TRINITY_DN18171_c0_g1_i2 [Ceriantheomorphe brasiliensis]